ncbi:hypothetical protein Acsp04_39310 [Actinomadura sp. NBRC 104425]|nr:hypothetical protein Acsp04_39310 [Actinomadura sp. NBRC 104425]
MVVDCTAYGLKAQNPVAVALPAARALLARRPEDVIARDIERTTGWVVWFGRVTGHYWATPRVPHPWARLLESDSPDGLRAAIVQVEMFYGGVAPLSGGRARVAVPCPRGDGGAGGGSGGRDSVTG